MPRHKDQRVGVFVDVQNLYYSAKQFYHSKVNFAHILERAVGGRQLIRAIAYVIKADIKEEVNFFEALEKIGYDVRAKDLQLFLGGAKKGDWDVGIAMDIMRMASKLDVIVLVSGDGDFKDLLEHVKSLGCRAELIAFKKTASTRVTNEADQFIDLDLELDKVLRGTKKPESEESLEHNKDIHRDMQIEVDLKKSEAQKKFNKPNPRNQGRRPPMQRNGNGPQRPNTNQSNRPQNRNREFKKDFGDRQERQDNISLIQRLNMEQPLLKPTSEGKPVEAKLKADTKKAPAKKTVLKPGEKKDSIKPVEAKPVEPEKPKKKESLLKKVVKKVTKSKKTEE